MRSWSTSTVVLVLAAGSAAGQCNFGFAGGAGGTPIPDLGTLAYSFTCNSYGTVGTLRVKLRILHARPGDLVIRLRNVTSGRVATLMNRPGTEDGVSTVGYTAANLGDVSLAGNGWFIFEDAAAGPYAVPPVGAYPLPGVANVHGSFKPSVDPFSTFAGLPLASAWSLEISDAAEGVTGLLNGRIIDFAPAEPVTCYANCDHSGAPPMLNVLDFACYLNEFADQSAYANCDGSTTPPVLNVLDFACFLNKFAAGCSAG